MNIQPYGLHLLHILAHYQPGSPCTTCRTLRHCARAAGGHRAVSKQVGDFKLPDYSVNTWRPAGAPWVVVAGGRGPVNGPP